MNKEEEWTTTTDPLRLIQLLRLFVGLERTRRKLRLFVCGFVRGGVPLPPGGEVDYILDFAERLADDVRSIDKAEWKRIQQRLRASQTDRTDAPDGQSFNLSIAVARDRSFNEDIRWIFAGRPPEREVREARALVLLREVFGNPFEPVDFAPWRTDTAVALARQMYDGRDFGAMPILADALQDAGCDNDEVLRHCRGEGPHVRGCWVVDGVLGLA